jgi:hypothetical protein
VRFLPGRLEAQGMEVAEPHLDVAFRYFSSSRQVVFRHR